MLMSVIMKASAERMWNHRLRLFNDIATVAEDDAAHS